MSLNNDIYLVYSKYVVYLYNNLKQIEIMRTAKVYITDKSNKRFFVEITGEAFIESSKRDLQRHLEQAKVNPERYTFLDLESAKIEVEINN